MDVFNKILESAPNTFTIFAPSGPVESGRAPMPHKSTLNLERGHLLPGGISTYGIGNGHLNYTGRLCQDPFNGAHAAIELIRGSEDALAASSGNIIDVPGFLSLDRSRSVAGGIPKSTYTLSVMGELLYTHEASSAPINEHIVVNISGTVITLIVNGVPNSVDVPEHLEFIGADNLSVCPAGGKLWAVVVRPEPVDAAYCEEVYEIMNDFPTPVRAEEQFIPTSFTFSREDVESMADYQLEDLDYEDAPKADTFRNGMVLMDQDMTYVPSFIERAGVEDFEWVIIDSSNVSPVVVGDLSESYDDHETYSTEGIGVKDVVGFSSLDKATKGDPSQVYLFFPLPTDSTTDPTLSMNMTFTDSTPSTYSESRPDRTANYDPATNLFISTRGYSLLNGGVRGALTVTADDPSAVSDEVDFAEGMDDDPTVEIVTESTAPQAYGGWFYVSSGSSGILMQSTAVTVTLNADKTLTGVGTNAVYVDGVLSTTPVKPGWRFIAAIPTAPAVVETIVGNDTVLTHSFSEYEAANPESYMLDLYFAYVDPETINPNPTGLNLYTGGDAERTTQRFLSYYVGDVITNYVGYTITVSVDVKASIARHLRAYGYQASGVSIEGIHYFTPSAPDVWERWSFTDVVYRYTDPPHPYSSGAIAFYDGTDAQIDGISYRNFKIEFGARHTGWSPSLDDPQTEFDDVFQVTHTGGRIYAHDWSISPAD